MIVNPDVNVYTHTQIRNHRKTFRKTQKSNNQLKSKRILNIEI